MSSRRHSTDSAAAQQRVCCVSGASLCYHAPGRNPMRSRFRSVLILVGSAAAVVLLQLAVVAAQAPTARQFPLYKAPRLAGHADLNGVWQALVTANWDIQDHEAQ